MTKESFVDYLEKSLEESLGEYDFAIDWNKAARAIKVSVHLFADNSKQIGFVDKDAVISQEEVLEFEDAALFYGQTKANSVKEQEYLTTIGFDEKQGLAKGLVDAFAQTLKETMDQAQEEFLDFLEETALVEGMIGKNDDEIKAYFASLAPEQQDVLLAALEKEELVFAFHFDQAAFNKRTAENLASPEGQRLLEYPIY